MDCFIPDQVVIGKFFKDGKEYSVRAESQVKKWNQEVGYNKYRSVITHKEPAGKGCRVKILEYERKRADEVRSQLDPNRHQRP